MAFFARIYLRGSFIGSSRTLRRLVAHWTTYERNGHRATLSPSVFSPPFPANPPEWRPWLTKMDLNPRRRRPPWHLFKFSTTLVYTTRNFRILLSFSKPVALQKLVMGFTRRAFAEQTGQSFPNTGSNGNLLADSSSNRSESQAALEIIFGKLRYLLSGTVSLLSKGQYCMY